MEDQPPTSNRSRLFVVYQDWLFLSIFVVRILGGIPIFPRFFFYVFDKTIHIEIGGAETWLGQTDCHVNLRSEYQAVIKSVGLREDPQKFTEFFFCCENRQRFMGYSPASHVRPEGRFQAGVFFRCSFWPGDGTQHLGIELSFSRCALIKTCYERLQLGSAINFYRIYMDLLCVAIGGTL